MSKSTKVLGNYSRRLNQLTSLSRTINGIARSAESISSSLMINRIVRSAMLPSSSLLMNGVVRSAVPPSSNLMINGVVRSAMLPSSSLLMNGVVRSAVPPSSNLMINGVVRSAMLPSSSRTINGIARSAGLISSSRVINGIVRSAELTSFSRTINGFARSAELASPFSRKFYETFAPFWEKAQFKDAEWFPHSTFPRHLLNWNGHESYSDEIVLSYYRQNWSAVRHVIEKELSECHVDKDAKEAVHQALIAHENRLYLLAPPSLFAAIERAVRVVLGDDNVGRIHVKNLLVDFAGQLPITALPGGFFGFVGFTQLSHHLYENIYTDDVRDRFADGSIPNRPCLHSWIGGLLLREE